MLFIIYAAVAILLGLGSVWAFCWYKLKLHLFELTEETTGIITKMTPSRYSTPPDCAGKAYYVRIKYTVNGRNYRTKMLYQPDEQPLIEGQEARVLYDPDKPSRAIPKDYDHNKARNTWKLCPILLTCLFALFLIIFIITLPDLIGLPKRSELIFKICTEFFFAAAMVAGCLLVRRTKAYKNEKERDPKGTRGVVLGGLALWGDIVISLIFNIIEFVVCYK